MLNETAKVTVDNQLLLWILGGIIAVAWAFIGWFRVDQKDVNKQLWDRANFHGHTIDCDNEKCKGAEAKDIILRGGK
jgi:hypothetical protein